MSDTDNGPEETNQSGCSFSDAFADAFWDVLDDYSFDNFLQELLINAIGGGLSKALSAYFKAAQGATGSAIDFVSDVTGGAAAGYTGGAIQEGADGLSGAEAGAIAISIGVGAAIGYAASGPFVFAGAVIGASIAGALAGITADAFDAARAAHQECLENEEAQEPESTPPDGPLDCPPVSPLIIDLDGDGVETLALDGSTTYFDLDGDGTAQRTAWVAPDDGLLVLDRNADGQINDITELFGSATEDGFSELAREDSNGDGVIDADDDVYADLRVWVDANSDGVAQEDELLTLDDAGITSIDLNATEEDYRVDGGAVSHSSTATLSGGGTAEVLDVWFDNNTAQTASPDAPEISTQAGRLPTLIGSGLVTDFQFAMDQDPALLEATRTLLIDAPDMSGTEFRARFEELLTLWAGAENVAVDSRGSWANGQHLAVLEAFYDYEYLQLSGVNAGRADPGPNAAYVVEQQYQQLLDGYLTQFSAQMAFSSVLLANDLGFEGDPRANSFAQNLADGTGLFLGQLVYDEGLNRVSISSAEAALKLVMENLPSADPLDFLDSIFSRLVGLKHQNFGGDENRFRDWLEEQLAPMSDAGLREIAVNIAIGNALIQGGDAADALTAGDEKPAFLVRQPVPITSVLAGGGGDDTLNGEAGGDIYVFQPGDGNDVIFDDFFAGLGGYGSGTLVDTYGNPLQEGAENPYLAASDQIIFLGRTSDQAIFDTDGSDLVITFNDGTTDSVRIQDFFAFSPAQRIDNASYSDGIYNQIELFLFADGPKTLAELSASEQDDLLLGTNGDDVLAGGLGDDEMRGEAGRDIYVHAAGDGDDVIVETFNSGIDFDRGEFLGDRILLPDYDLTDLTLMRSGDDVTLGFIPPENGSVTILGQGISASLGVYANGAVEGVQFSDGQILRMDTIDIFLNGDPDGTLYANTYTTADADANGDVDGNQSASRANDVFLGGSAAVTFNGGAGHDTYILHDADGIVTIEDRVTTFSTINQFEDDEDTLILRGISFDELSFQRLGTDMIVFLGGIEVLRSTSQYRDNFTFGIERRDGVELIIDQDGATFAQADWEALTLTVGTIGDDFVSGIDYIRNDNTVYYNSDTYQMGLGDDTIRDENGSETYIYSLGDGNDIVEDDAGYFRYDPGNDTDRLVLTDLNLEDVQLRRVEYFGGGEEDFGFGASALEVFAVADGGSVLFVNQFGDELSGLEEIEFADGTVIDRVQIAELAVQYGTEFDDFLEGEGKIRGLGGDDQISSYGGNVQAIYALGDGNDSLFGVSILEFVDINSDGVRLLRGPADELLIEILATGEVLSVNEDGGVGPNPFPGDFNLGFASLANIEAGDFGTEFLTEIRFASGEIWDALRIAAEIQIPTTEGDDVVQGTLDDDLIDGGAGDDLINGGDGNDRLSGGAGNDAVQGGAGNDLILLSPDDVSIDGGTGRDTLSAEGLTGPATIDLGLGLAGSTTVQGIEDLIGSKSGDTLIGDDGDNVINGGAGADDMRGGGGDDILRGGRGPDSLDGGTGTDTASYATSLGGVSVALDGSSGENGDAAGDVLTDIENLEGSNYSDVLTGDGTANVIDGLSGNDTINAEEGDDDVSGGAGQDALNGGAGNDMLDGGAGRDIINGGTGDDMIIGGAGNDVSEGGEGSDTYVWSRYDGDDLIIDTGAASDTDVLVLQDVTPEEISFLRLGDRLHVIVHGGETIRIEDQFNGAGIEEIRFDDGTTITRAAFESSAQILENQAPIAFADNEISVSDKTVVLAASELLKNDYDHEGDVLSINSVQESSGGTVSLNGDGDVIFTSDGTSASASFSYTVSDGDMGNTVRVDLTVDVSNTAPELVSPLSDVVSEEDQPIDIVIPAGAFTDEDGDILSLNAMLVGGAELPVWLNFDGSRFTGTPPTDFNGLLEIEVTASDGTLSVSDVFALEVTPVNDAPTFSGQSSFSIDENTTLVGDILGDDVDGDQIVYAIDGGADAALFEIDENTGSLSFIDAPDFEAPGDVGGDNQYDVTVSLSDGLADTTVDVSVTVEDVDEGTGPLEVLGTEGRDRLVGTAADEVFYAFGGSLDQMTGNGGSDTFVFGAELSNGLRERDIIRDFDSTDDLLILADDNYTVRELRSGLVISHGGDRDLIYVLGDDLTVDNVQIGIGTFDDYLL